MSPWFASVPDWGWAYGASASLALGAWWRGSLSRGGTVAAGLVGGTIGWAFGVEGFLVLCAFFVTATSLGRVGRSRKRRLETHYAKGHRRDAMQVMANGGVAMGCAALALLHGHLQGTSPVDGGLGAPLGVAACASLASANADTWATELGVLSRVQPWHLFTCRRVPAGTSGAVSGLGCAVAVAGAATIGITAWGTSASFAAGQVLLVTAVGFGGALVDSALGATLQRQYTCTMCGEQVEAAIHCEAPTRLVGPSWARLDNDAVNLLANLSAAIVAGGAVRFVGAG